MLGGNTFITIWNRSGNTFYRHELTTLCRFTQSTTRSTSGVGDAMFTRIASTVVCRIPDTKNYLPPLDWEALDPDEKSKYYTIQVDDYIALGIQPYEIGRVENFPVGTLVLTAPDLRKSLGQRVMQAKVIRYSLKAQRGRHIRVEGV